MLSKFAETAFTAQRLLDDNTDWIARYAAYANGIGSNSSKIESSKQQFKEWKPLFAYMPIGNAKGNPKLFLLRFKGQTVARLNADDTGTVLSTRGYSDFNRKYFGVTANLDSPVLWNSQPAAEFRKQFAQSSGNPRQLEHALESALLAELEKDTRETKDASLCGIRPVKIADICRFQMKTPFAASKLPISYSARDSGGGIDILARVSSGNASSLCVMELKIAEKDAAHAAHQGIAYAVFVQNLLASESGDNWYSIFGYKRDLKKLDVKVCTVVPSSAQKPLPEYAGQSIETRHGAIELHCMHVNTDWKNCLRVENNSLS